MGLKAYENPYISICLTHFADWKGKHEHFGPNSKACNRPFLSAFHSASVHFHSALSRDTFFRRDFNFEKLNRCTSRRAHSLFNQVCNERYIDSEFESHVGGWAIEGQVRLPANSDAWPGAPADIDLLFIFITCVCSDRYLVRRSRIITVRFTQLFVVSVDGSGVPTMFRNLVESRQQSKR